MTEKEMEDLLWAHPEKLLNESLRPFRRQQRSGVGQSDLVFKDRHDRLLVIELKRGKLPREAIGQLHDYFGMMKNEFPDQPVELMVVANFIPPERKLACEQYDIECREISEKRFRDLAAEVGYTFQSDLKETAKPEPLFERPPAGSAGDSGKSTSWSFGSPSKSGSRDDFLARCDEEGRVFFTALLDRLTAQAATRTKITWNHESGFSTQFYFRRLGFVEMVWGFPVRNMEGKPCRYGQSLVFPFDFAKRRNIPVEFLNSFGQALSSAAPLSPAPKRPSIPVRNLTETEVKHILSTILEYIEKASQL